MPATRSSTRSSAPTVNAASGVFSTKDDQLMQNAEKLGASPRKRKAMASSTFKTTATKSELNTPEVQISALASSPIPSDQDASEPEAFVPAMLSFDFEEAKRHLIEVDHRFEDLFSKMQCKPFQHLEQVHPFRYEDFFKCI
jgi:DNA-3-methyladenine glycosylase II